MFSSLGVSCWLDLVVLMRVKTNMSPTPNLYSVALGSSGHLFPILLSGRLFSINLEKLTVSPMPILYSLGKLFWEILISKQGFQE